jgi:hypothetical protein
MLKLERRRVMDATQEIDKRVTSKEEEPPDPILRFVKLWWGFWFPALVNQDAKRPSEVFPLLNPPWQRWWL